MNHLLRLVASLVVLVSIACGGHTPTRPALHPAPRDSLNRDRFVAGTAIADITPPLHLSLFGHGPESRVATGVRLRLRCQVFVVASNENVLALIPCDLQSSSAALHREIEKRLLDVGIPLTADKIYLMANHTHAGPAHYFEARRYSGTFSSATPGYDQEVVDFLADRISDAVVRAYASTAPACVGWERTTLEGLTFNRAYVPFLANEPDGTVGPKLKQAERADYEYGQSEPGSRTEMLSGAEEAVDHGLFVMRIDSRAPGAASCEAKGPPVGVLAVFGMHPTGIPNTNELYHGDIFGFATRTAAACLHRAKPLKDRIAGSSELSFDENRTDCDDIGATSEEVVVGLANGVEGDVSPKLTFQSVPNARRLGRQLGIEIARTAAGIKTTSASGRVKRAYWELWFPEARADGEHRLCEFGELGMAMAGGAHDGATRLRVIPEANAGFRLDVPGDLCQSRKLPVRQLFGPGCHDYPRFGAIGLLEVGSARFATVPAEPTTATGLRIRAALKPWSADVDKIAIVGLTNHYLQYIATREEYDFQYYEGASTLYGPYSSRFLVRSFRCLAQWMGTNVDPKCGNRRPINKVGSFHPSPDPKAARFPATEDITPLELTNVPFVPSWPDGDRGWQMTFPRMPLTFTSDRELFRVEVFAGMSGETVVDDDRGSSIEVREVDEGDRWRARWTPNLEGSARELRCGEWFRLAVRGRFRITSKPFQVTCEERRGGP